VNKVHKSGPYFSDHNVSREKPKQHGEEKERQGETTHNEEKNGKVYREMK